MGSVSTNLADAIERLDQLFSVNQKTLKEICQRFQEELEDGLAANGRNIPMNVTWVQALPTGKETGSFLTIDLGGTNIRICWITLTGGSVDAKIKQQQYQVGDGIKSGNAEELWDFVAGSLEAFIRDQNLDGSQGDPLPLGFTFSYPASQDKIDHGVLQTWTKGFDIKGVEGKDVVLQLKDAMQKKKLPVKLVALVNDTTGALIASHYSDSETIIGAIFGTGCNAAYMENTFSIPKLKHAPSGGRMAINCEYGAFDNDHKVLPRTQYDKQIDAQSPRPGEQAFEKMSAGLYLGEIYRLVLLDLHEQGVILQNQDISKLQAPYILDTGFLSGLENDESPGQKDSLKQFKDILGVEPSKEELAALQHLAQTVTVRGARLCACGVGAICMKTGIKKGHIAADGSVANKHPKFKDRWSEALGEILDWQDGETPITMTSAEDGSGVGAAVIAALALEHRWGD
ncbi:uncharacterized protein HMPREF1541_04231 [Cyphellophora europaea CBS 101466]|uniref:Phosphotransferase n=1 Tax=Cyphellophora europaea (strain CBS 101466) TaxID=1220924 RepID=W2S122_CYPE1|nr:uncharacterized protein HMPREF1541_04231 [Cyphellophora europaea CBS 101466]ETN42290.1 hypothetical protein HMPREF1541_04231 [Cyphellophora europaea CBS 101466]